MGNKKELKSFLPSKIVSLLLSPLLIADHYFITNKLVSMSVCLVEEKCIVLSNGI